MSIIDAANETLIRPVVETVRRPDEVYATDCGVVVQEPWGPQIYGNCHRQGWFKRHNVAASGCVRPENARRAYWGNVLEDAEMELYKRAGIFIANQVGFWVPEHGMRGRIDGFVRDPDNNNAIVGVEIKSTWSYGALGAIRGKKGKPAVPKMEHVIQAAVYHWHFQRFARCWHIIYLARDSGETKQHTVVVADKQISVNGQFLSFTMDDIFARLKVYVAALWQPSPPQRDYSLVYSKEQLEARANGGAFGKTDTEKIHAGRKVVKGSWECAWCPFAKLCWQGVELPFRDAKIDEILS